MESDILLGQVKVERSAAALVKKELAETLRKFVKKHRGSLFMGIELASEVFGSSDVVLSSLDSPAVNDRVAANREIFDPPEWMPGE